MPGSCAAHGCSNRYDKKRPDLLFKTIPKDEKLNKLWKANIRRTDDLPKDHNIVICWKHFTDDCIERDLKAEFESRSENR